MIITKAFAVASARISVLLNVDAAGGECGASAVRVVLLTEDRKPIAGGKAEVARTKGRAVEVQWKGRESPSAWINVGVTPGTRLRLHFKLLGSARLYAFRVRS